MINAICRDARLWVSTLNYTLCVFIEFKLKEKKRRCSRKVRVEVSQSSAKFRKINLLKYSLNFLSFYLVPSCAL